MRGSDPIGGESSRLLIAIAAEARYLAQRQPAGLAAALARSGHAPLVIDPQAAAGVPLEDMTLLVARGRSAAMLELLARAERAGVTTINRRAAIASVFDKARMARTLERARIPSPPTRAGSIRALAAALRAPDYPIVVKPVFGDNGRGVRVVRRRSEFLKMAWDEPLALAQRYIPSDGFDLKLYVVGSEVQAVLKPSPLSPAPDAAAQLVPVTAAMRAVALRCGILFGLELFGVDCIATPQGPVVIEVNDFPNYSGVDGADDALARYVIERARAAFALRRP